MTNFFQFKNQREPPRLVDRGTLQYMTKSDINQCLNPPTRLAVAAKQATTVVLDMPAVIHIIRLTTADTVRVFAAQYFPHLDKRRMVPKESITSNLTHSSDTGRAHGQESAFQS